MFYIKFEIKSFIIVYLNTNFFTSTDGSHGGGGGTIPHRIWVSQWGDRFESHVGGRERKWRILKTVSPQIIE